MRIAHKEGGKRDRKYVLCIKQDLNICTALESIRVIIESRLNISTMQRTLPISRFVCRKPLTQCSTLLLLMPRRGGLLYLYNGKNFLDDSMIRFVFSKPMLSPRFERQFWFRGQRFLFSKPMLSPRFQRQFWFWGQITEYENCPQNNSIALHNCRTYPTVCTSTFFRIKNGTRVQQSRNCLHKIEGLY